MSTRQRLLSGGPPATRQSAHACTTSGCQVVGHQLGRAERWSIARLGNATRVRQRLAAAGLPPAAPDTPAGAVRAPSSGARVSPRLAPGLISRSPPATTVSPSLQHHHSYSRYSSTHRSVGHPGSSAWPVVYDGEWLSEDGWGWPRGWPAVIDIVISCHVGGSGPGRSCRSLSREQAAAGGANEDFHRIARALHARSLCTAKRRRYAPFRQQNGGRRYGLRPTRRSLAQAAI
jgi:hypothetical protein